MLQEMTLKQIYQNGKEQLRKAGVESPAFDAICLFEAAFGIGRQGLAVHGGEVAHPGQAGRFREMIRQRAEKRPLQYILGEWPFLSLRLAIGEGVLIPREDTEVLVRAAAESLQSRESVRALDLCAGTGAVGLGLASLLPQAKVTCIEWFDEALAYLNRNILQNTRGNPRLAVDCVQADVLSKDTPEQFGKVDAILSNPPYVETGVLPTLQEEVRREPSTALDGGRDGLVFYRALAENWIPQLRPNGVMAVGVGEHRPVKYRICFAKPD